jgi:hypothetical protein
LWNILLIGGASGGNSSSSLTILLLLTFNGPIFIGIEAGSKPALRQRSLNDPISFIIIVSAPRSAEAPYQQTCNDDQTNTTSHGNGYDGAGWKAAIV